MQQLHAYIEFPLNKLQHVTAKCRVQSGDAIARNV